MNVWLQGLIGLLSISLFVFVDYTVTWTVARLHAQANTVDVVTRALKWRGVPHRLARRFSSHTLAREEPLCGP